MNYPPIYLCDTLAFNLNELIMQDFANAVETVSKMKDLSSCRVFLVNSAAFHKYERHCHTFIFFHVEISSILVTMKQTSSFKNHSCQRTHFSIQSSKCFSSINLFASFPPQGENKWPEKSPSDKNKRLSLNLEQNILVVIEKVIQEKSAKKSICRESTHYYLYYDIFDNIFLRKQCVSFEWSEMHDI